MVLSVASIALPTVRNVTWFQETVQNVLENGTARNAQSDARTAVTEDATKQLAIVKSVFLLIGGLSVLKHVVLGVRNTSVIRKQDNVHAAP